MTNHVLKPGVHCVMATPFLPDEQPAPLALVERAQHVAPDTSKSIDSDTNGHGVFLYRQMC